MDNLSKNYTLYRNDATAEIYSKYFSSIGGRLKCSYINFHSFRINDLSFITDINVDLALLDKHIKFPSDTQFGLYFDIKTFFKDLFNENIRFINATTSTFEYTVFLTHDESTEDFPINVGMCGITDYQRKKQLMFWRIEDNAPLSVNTRVINPDRMTIFVKFIHD